MKTSPETEDDDLLRCPNCETPLERVYQLCDTVVQYDFRLPANGYGPFETTTLYDSNHNCRWHCSVCNDELAGEMLDEVIHLLD